ncbi:hypothetical protein Zmor_020037 [Zophobas morio]|uniref:Major facilitator superfamily (MFS) profile domain-containing protein n=1 Tax=Zophobas morio TaxID=2755281 RepID=A0AA38M9Z0_9CUCU|nr:hypothetical protein Zmor_020037 [Zophobas morio]
MPRHTFRSLIINVEVPLFCWFFAFMFSDPIKSNLIIFRTCYLTLGYSKTECALLGSQNPDDQTANLEKVVQPFAAVTGMMNTVVEGFCSSIVCLFVGPWSDRFGRKPIIVAPLIGYFLYFVLTTIFSLVETASPWYSVICTLPVGLSGGIPSLFAAILCHVTDSTSQENRGMKMGVIECTIFLGIVLGTVSSSYIFTFTSYEFVFSLGAICCLVGLIFTIYCIPESIANQESEGKIKELFRVSNINEMVTTTFKKRDNYVRFTVLCCILMITLSTITVTGGGSVMFLFLREQFHWSLQKYTLFAAAGSVCQILGTISAVYVLHKVLKIPETVLILVALLSSLNGALMMGLAHSYWTVYFVPLAKLLDGIFGPMVRSLVSKVLPNEEIGKVFASLTACQFFLGIVGSPLYTLIYNDTISTSPGFFNFVTAGIYIFEICVVIGVIVVRTVATKSPFEVLINESMEDVHLDDEVDS